MGYAEQTSHLKVVREEKKRMAIRIPVPAFIPLLVMLPDISAFVADNTQAWIAWLTLTQVSMAGLCLLAVATPKTYAMRVSLCAAALWYVTQAVDEAVAGNVFADSGVEYVVFLIYTALIGLHLYRHERERRIP